MKKLISLVLCLVLVLGLAAVGFATETEEPAAPPVATDPPAPDPVPTTPPATDPPATDPPATEPPVVTPPETDPPATTPPETNPPTPDSCTHVWGEWDGDETTHRRSCTLCGTEVAGAHNWSQTGSVLVAATCVEAGVMGHTCSGCDMLLLVEIPMTGKHTYDNKCDADCNVCGETRDAGHKYSEAWTYSYQGHWHACLVCGAKDELRDHYPGPAATEEEDQICLTCGYVMTPRLNHTHNYKDTWSYDKTGHFYECDGCTDRKDFEVHSFDDLCDPDCNVCGYKTDAAHSWDEDWQCDETGHWSECVLCGEIGEPQDHVPGEEATELASQVCTLCGFALAPRLEHTHTPGDTWVTDETNHRRACACGEVMDLGAHDFDAGVVNEDTTVTYVCMDCGYEKTEGEPLEGSDFPWGILLVLIILAAGSAVVALIFVLKAAKKPGKFHR